jgi:hypothetical protein
MVVDGGAIVDVKAMLTAEEVPKNLSYWCL